MLFFLELIMTFVLNLSLADSSPRAFAAFSGLQSWWNAAKAEWLPMGWWNEANSLEACANYASLVHPEKTGFEVLAASIFAKQSNETLLTAKYFDDIQWWALAWLRAYELTSDQAYLARAELIWSRVLHESWTADACGGGCYWSTAMSYKNAITNELFFTLSVRLSALAAPVERAKYREQADLSWKWFSSSGLINRQNLVNDGLSIDSKNSSRCVNNNQTTWTYNQGVLLGGLIELAMENERNDKPRKPSSVTFLQKQTQKDTLLAVATKIASATMKTLVWPNSGGVLKEACDPDHCGADGWQFKGIFVRYVGYWITLAQQTPEEPVPSFFKPFLVTNAQSVWTSDQCNCGSKGDGCFGNSWIGPCVRDKTDPIRQTSALDLFTSASLLS